MLPLLAGAGGPATRPDEPTSSTRSADTDRAVRPTFAPLALDSPYATGDWLGLRTQLEDAGVATQFFYNDTYQWNVRGGLDEVGKNGATIDWFVTLDFDRLRLVPGGTLLVHARRQWREGVNPFVGSLGQVQDDLDGNRSLHIDQLYWEQTLVKDKAWLRVGYLDFQTIVDRNAFANSEDVQFMNLAFDNNPLLPLPIGLGASLAIRPAGWLTITAGAADAEAVLFQPGFSTAFGGAARYIWFLEPALNVSIPDPRGAGPLPGTYRFGMVSDPRPRMVFVPRGTRPALAPERGDDQGFYVSFDQMLFCESARDRQGLGVFGRYGFRHGDVNPVSNFWSIGLTYQGLVPTRDADVLGIAAGQSLPSRRLHDRTGGWAEEETVGELYYSIAVTRWLTVTLDVQYISSPGIGADVDDAIVLGIRARIGF